MKKIKIVNLLVSSAVLGQVLAVSTLGQSEDAEALAKQAQNPVANLISLPFQNNINLGIGPDDETQNVLNIQPVWPVSIADDWNLITRTIVPVASQPGYYTGGEGRVAGLGDTTFAAYLSPRAPSAFTWGVGPILLLPTATDDVLGADKWGAGISAIGLVMPGQWVIGSVISELVSFAGSGEQDVNLLTWQYFINYNLPKAWYLTSAPIITANWEADSGDVWTIPFGGGFGRVFNIGSQPVNCQVQAFDNVEGPENGPDWQVRLQVQLLFPK